jgi:hypothetical protein
MGQVKSSQGPKNDRVEVRLRFPQNFRDPREVESLIRLRLRQAARGAASRLHFGLPDRLRPIGESLWRLGQLFTHSQPLGLPSAARVRLPRGHVAGPGHFGPAPRRSAERFVASRHRVGTHSFTRRAVRWPFPLNAAGGARGVGGIRVRYPGTSSQRLHRSSRRSTIALTPRGHHFAGARMTSKGPDASHNACSCSGNPVVSYSGMRNPATVPLGLHRTALARRRPAPRTRPRGSMLGRSDRSAILRDQ